jgi:streptogramin lyase
MKTGLLCLLAAAPLLACAPAAQAIIIYATSYEGHAIYKVDTVPATATLFYDTNNFTPSNQPDSLLFDTSGNIIYTGHLLGTVHKLTVPGLVDTQIASPSDGFIHPSDLSLEPSGITVLASDFNNNVLKRVSLTGGGTTIVATLPGGMHYSGSTYATNITGPHLFINAESATGDQVLELDPVTGTTLNASVPNLNLDLDGLCFDSLTGHLWACSQTSGELVEFAPGSLTYVIHSLPTLSGNSLLPDGICTDSAGSIFWASRKDFNITWNAPLQAAAGGVLVSYNVKILIDASFVLPSEEPAQA